MVMGETNRHHNLRIAHDAQPILPFLLLPLLLSLTSALKLELIHPDSPKSPLYPGNLTESQRITRLVSFADARALQLTSELLPPSADPTSIRTPLRQMGRFLYTVRLGIGTPPTFYHLLFDTGSFLTWVQCSGCNPCFHQTPPLFNPRRSSTSSLLPCTSDRVWFRCVNGKCQYTHQYGAGAARRDGPVTRGVLYKDTFTFSDQKQVHGVSFGCSDSSRRFDGMFKGEIDGVMGLNKNPVSLASQLTPHSHTLFSYCLHELSSNYLLFGPDAVMRERDGVVTTRLLDGPLPDHFYVRLLDASLDGRRLNIPPGTFEGNGERGGVVIDTGSPFTFLIGPAYERIVAAVGEHMEGRGYERVDGMPYMALEHCWRLKSLRLPTMAFHFQGGDLVVKSRNLFFFRSRPFEFFCLAMKPMDVMTIIGVKQQQDTRFMFDVDGKLLKFVAADCAEHL